MDYEKRYRELVNAVKMLKETNPSDEGIQNWVTENVPELVESEDERIKSNIIAAIKGVGYYDCDLTNECIDWIEKQCKSSGQIHYWTEEEIEPIISDYLRGAEHYGGMIGRLRCLKPKSLEKQGEQKVSVVEFNAQDWYVSKVDGKIYNAKFMEKTPTHQTRKLEIEKAAMSATGIIEQEEWFIKGAEWADENPSCVQIEKQGEKKPADMVEPKDYSSIDPHFFKPTDKVELKFHEGDILKHNKANIICKVISVNSGSYYVENIKTNGRIELFNAEQNFHLWTIQDAKDGDVLAVERDKTPFIFKGFDKFHPECPVAYCGIDDSGIFVNSDDGWWTDEKVGPATKEQRDLLFQKMKDAGYEWDSEKKELKKIHVIDEGKAEMDYCFTKMMNGEKVSSAWSEEDENKLSSCIDAIEACYKWDNMIEWLKSLKQRIGG